MNFQRIFCLLLFSFVLLRTLFLASLLMPFEGWDEYQHLAMPQFIDQHHRIPTPADPVPVEMAGFLCSHPHPDYSAKQLAGLAVRNYAGQSWQNETWSGATNPTGASLIMPGLYQAQHGSVFYRVMVMLKSLVATDSFLLWADLGRILNALLAALTAVIWFQLLSLIFRRGPLAVLPYLLCLALASNSLFAYCHARVANDGLAVFLGSAALLVFVQAVRPGHPWRGGRFWAKLLYLGLITGLCVMSKATGLVLVPVIVAGFLCAARQKKAGLSRAMGVVLVFSAAYLTVAGPYHLENFQKSGTVTGMVEAVHNSTEGQDTWALLTALSGLEPYPIMRLFFYDYLHCGGWSYLRSPSWLHLGFAWLVQGCLLLLAGALLLRRPRRIIWSVCRTAPVLPLLLLFTWAGLLYHLVHSLAARGEIFTNPWYGILAFPALVLLLLLGAQGLWRWGAGWLGLLLAAIFSWAYYGETFGRMLRHQTGLTGLQESVTRIQSHHILLKIPLGLGLSSELLFMAGLWIVAVLVLIRVSQASTASVSPGLGTATEKPCLPR